MKAFAPLFVLLALMALFAWLRRGHGGKFGQMVRDSDHAAWRDAVADKEAELAALRAAQPNSRAATRESANG